MTDAFEVKLTRQDRYRFEVEFQDEGNTTLSMDEPEPLGDGSGPNAARVLASAIGNCLSASLLYCLDKARIEVGEVRTHVTGSIVRNQEGRFRVDSLSVRIEPELRTASPARIQRCLDVFEDFCIVTASVRSGLDVHVEVDAETRVPDRGTLVEAGAVG